MIFEFAFEDAEKELKENFFDYDSLVYFDLKVQGIPKSRYKPFVRYALTLEDSFIVTAFMVVLVRKDDLGDVPRFIYTTYDQSLGRNGIYRYI